MGRQYDSLTEAVGEWIARQPMFFVATAPLAADGHVNVSPKGLAGTFVVLGEHRVAYLDLTGSGIETVAHVRENGRITLMFCAFDGPARIVRLSGRGGVVTCDEPTFADLAAPFPTLPGARAVITVDVDRVADSCGYGVPRRSLLEQRERPVTSLESRREDGLVAYRAERNAVSMDGQPGY
jgi:hypothetical protein